MATDCCRGRSAADLREALVRDARELALVARRRVTDEHEAPPVRGGAQQRLDVRTRDVAHVDKAERHARGRRRVAVDDLAQHQRRRERVRLGHHGAEVDVRVEHRRVARPPRGDVLREVRRDGALRRRLADAVRVAARYRRPVVPVALGEDVVERAVRALDCRARAFCW